MMSHISVARVTEEADFHLMLDIFEKAFGDEENYGKRTRPGDTYIKSLVNSDGFLGLLAKGEAGSPVGALAAYILKKFERERTEIYIYDLAVEISQRRKGVATSLINELREIGRRLGAYVLFVQADKGKEDLPAQELYRKLGTQEDVFHYDIEI
jgi:aminoglycoside 3-N-acetyltransferase I